MNRIQQIFRDHSDAYMACYGHAMPGSHQKTIHAICACRSGAVGYHLYECPNCGEHHVALSSCGNRHCPVCQNEKAARWVWKQQQRLLPCEYFMVTFTMPEPLRSTARAHQKQVYTALFDQSADALRTLLADQRFLGCDLSGFFAVLHTWGRQLQYHPHVHLVVPGGGLSKDRAEWIGSRNQFLVHVRALSRLFRGKMKAAMDAAGLLEEIPPAVWEQEWVVHAKPVGDGRHIMKYLGTYVFRVAISDARIVHYDGKNVTFKYQKVGASRWRKVTVSAFEFMRRYLQHVLPKGVMKVRHYGFLSPNCRVSLQCIREMICVLYEVLREYLPKVKPPKPPRPLRCKTCASTMQWVCFIRPPALQAPPG